MSGSTSNSTLTVPAPPSTAEVAADILAWFGGQSGVLTDFNPGSQVRTESEATGSVVEMQGVISQAEAFQAMVYSAWAAFNIIPFAATPSSGTVTFSTGTGASPPTVPSPVLIPSNTVIQTVGGIQFQTTASVTIPTGGTSISAPVEAVVAGLGGNVAAGAITQIASGLSYPLSVTNSAATTGGTDAETPTQTMARFTAAVGALYIDTPVGIANGAIGVGVSGTAEKVLFATVYEQWVEQVANNQTPTPGFTVYVDNGTGTASANLLTAVSTALSGNYSTGEIGMRPAGVPFSVLAVTPIYCSVAVSGTAVNPALDAQLDSSVTTAVEAYFSGLQFGETADSTQLIATVANQVAGDVSSLNVLLLNVSGVSVQTIAVGGSQRVILQNLTVDFT